MDAIDCLVLHHGGGALAPSQALNERPDLYWLCAEGVFRGNRLSAITEREGETKGWWLGQPGIGYSQMHRDQALMIRRLQRIRNR